MPSLCRDDSKICMTNDEHIGTMGMLPNHVPTASTTSTSRSLIGIGLTDRRDLQSVHTYLGIVHLEL